MAEDGGPPGDPPVQSPNIQKQLAPSIASIAPLTPT